ncbi:type II secretion system F family protein [Photobacterium sp. GJ3]|uniref:type II secretion system F family protein n=1 Tax=Photobacterium sp. GJ3 TaxID=2829502 RepID=UPI002011023E|nr:type II secretion system F family protein [Photobacterium sp. GJ3]
MSNPALMSVLVISVWLMAVGYGWHRQRQRTHWQQQARRYSPYRLKAETSSGRSMPEWYLTMATVLGAKRMQFWQRVVPAAVIGMTVLLLVNGMSAAVALGLSLTVTVLGVWFVYHQLQQQALDAFRDQLPEVIDGMIRAVRVGAPMADTFAVIAEQYAQADDQRAVVSRLFGQMHDELSVGQPLTETLSRAAARMPVAEFRFLTVVLSLQQETGGRLSEVLAQLGATLRGRKELQASVASITSESRSSAKVLAALPVLIVLVLFSAGREHFDFLMATTQGQIVLAYVVGSVLFGLFLIRRLTQIKA